MSPHPHPSSAPPPPGPRLRRALLSISQQAERDLEQMAAGDSQTRIHSLRVRMKKLRALLRLIEPGLSAASLKAIQRHMRVLKKAFAMNRDQHVLNALLAEFSDGDTASCRSDYAAPETGAFANGLPEPARLRKLQAARALAASAPSDASFANHDHPPARLEGGEPRLCQTLCQSPEVASSLRAETLPRALASVAVSGEGSLL